MKKIFIPLFTVLLLAACSTDLLEDVNEISTNEISLRGEKITVCHYSQEEGTWKEKQININAIPSHRAHGDAVDMDGDGYYDIENGCGPVDCDDSHSELTNDCCEDFCVFCDHPDYYRLNFTDCIDGRLYDFYVSRTEDYRGCDYYGCDDFVSASAVIFDAEGRWSPDCDGDPSTWHFGYIYATNYIYCGVEYSLSNFHYTDSEGVFIFENVTLTPDEARSCIASIEKIASDLGLENIGIDKTCEDLLQDKTSLFNQLIPERRKSIHEIESMLLKEGLLRQNAFMQENKE